MTNINSGSCRACLRVTPKMVSIFEPYRSFTIAHFMNSVADIKIANCQKNLPEDLCSICLEELEVVLNFMNKCKETDKYLRSLSQIPADSSERSEVKEEPLHEIKSEGDEEINTLEIDFDDESLAEDDGDKLDVDLKDEEPKMKEPTITYYECHDCGERLRTKCKMRVHWKRTHSSFTCVKCKRVFKLFHSFKKHSQTCCVDLSVIKIVVEGKKRRFYCKHCDYETHRYNNIRIHSFRHTGERAYPCDICGKTYTQWSSLYSHKEGAHKLYKMEITCDYCGKHIKGRLKCYRHLKLHLETTFQCDICKVVLKRKKSLQDHIKKHYIKKQNTATACDICGKVFFSHNGVQIHKKLMHIVTVHSCKMCKYQNKNVYYVRNHEKRHFQENMLQCEICYKFFEGQEKINRHMNVDHGSKTHICVFCKRGFMKKYTLINHQTKNHAELLKSNNGPTYLRISTAKSRKNSAVPGEDI